MRKWTTFCFILTLFLLYPLKYSTGRSDNSFMNSSYEIQEIAQYDDNYGIVQCMTGDNDTLYVGTNVGFLLLNRSDPLTLNYLCEIPGENIEYIHVKNKILYGHSNEGLLAYNTTNPKEPILIESYSTNETLKDFYFNIDSDFGYKVVDDDVNKCVVILNFTNPRNITEISRYVVPESYVLDLFIKENFIYYTTFDGLSIINATDPSNPYRIANFTTNFSDGYDSLYVDDRKIIYLYSNFEKSILALNGSDTSSLQILDELSVYSRRIIGYENTLLIENNDSNTDYIVVNTTDPTDLEILGNISYRAWNEPRDSFDLLWNSDSIFYSSQWKEVIILDMNDILNPVISKIFDCGGFACDIEIIGKNAYIPNFYKGIEIYDISNKSNPSFLSTCQDDIFTAGLLKDNSYVYSYGEGDFDIYELTNPLDFSLIGSSRSTLPFGQPSIYRDHLYFIGGCEGMLSIFNIKDKANPEIEKIVQGYGFRSIATQANKLYGLGLGNFPAFFIFDISKPKKIELLYDYNVSTFSDYSEIVVNKNKVYIALEDRFMVLELSKSNEVIHKQELVDPTLFPLDLVITENYAIIGSNEGVKIIQLATMTELVRYYDGGRAMELAVVDNTIFVADGYDDLEILETNFELGEVLGLESVALDVIISEIIGIALPIIVLIPLIQRRKKN